MNGIYTFWKSVKTYFSFSTDEKESEWFLELLAACMQGWWLDWAVIVQGNWIYFEGWVNLKMFTDY